ncbi:OmpA family protein [Pseudomonas sp. BW16M2]|uniref:OmpA family protein n=1 Tax=Pseudomonas sp. BW16M2 TaxID=2745489 RepID=UPI0016445843|nr:OmpA family protein [Pseudomonas sp. BW16M2]MBC3438211.1 OmpA family protein [Pseudomonas sp. BW16M2]
MLKRSIPLHATLLALAICSAPEVIAADAFGDLYRPVAPVGTQQAQVVYYRAAAMGAQPGSANVYVDREFHTGLLPGGYSAFCVSPGTHTLGAYLNDAPQYRGKTTDVYSAELEGGQTYFLKASEGGVSTPQAVTRAQAEVDLTNMRQQIHALSRASSVQACNYLPASAPRKDYTLSSDVLFRFGKSSYGDISPEGRDAVRQLARQIKADNATLQHIEVIGHTDPIGSAAANQALGLQRAQTVRRVLIDAGLPGSSIQASSRGDSESLSSGCSGSRAEQIDCYAPDRRVVVRVKTQQ